MNINLCLLCLQARTRAAFNLKINHHLAGQSELRSQQHWGIQFHIIFQVVNEVIKAQWHSVVKIKRSQSVSDKIQRDTQCKTVTRCTIKTRAWTILFFFSPSSPSFSLSAPPCLRFAVIPVRGKPKWSPLGCSLRGSRQWKSYFYFSAGSECLPVSAYYVKCVWDDETKIHLTCLDLTSVDSLRF